MAPKARTVSRIGTAMDIFFFAGFCSTGAVDSVGTSTSVSVGRVVASVEGSVGAVVSATVRRKVTSMVCPAWTSRKVYTPTEPMLLPSTFTSSTTKPSSGLAVKLMLFPLAAATWPLGSRLPPVPAVAVMV